MQVASDHRTVCDNQFCAPFCALTICQATVTSLHIEYFLAIVLCDRVLSPVCTERGRGKQITP